MSRARVGPTMPKKVPRSISVVVLNGDLDDPRPEVVGQSEGLEIVRPVVRPVNEGHGKNREIPLPAVDYPNMRPPQPGLLFRDPAHQPEHSVVRGEEESHYHYVSAMPPRPSGAAASQPMP